ncbi:MAG: hypothetical protein ACK5LN_06875 [Propioniciclava sp.]
MTKKVLAFVAVVITVLYAVGFAVWTVDDAYTVVGAIVVLLAWIGVGVLGKGGNGPSGT